MKIDIKMIDEKISIGGDIEGEWTDLRMSSVKVINNMATEGIFKGGNGINYKKGDVILLGLGIATSLPKGYEAIINPRSSTFKNYGFILTNSQGVIDNTYRGEWMANFYCTRDGFINHGDRILQFRIQKQQEKITFNIVDELDKTERGTGGFGSTGVK